MNQIADIVNCGYVRHKGFGTRRERVGDKVYWSIGGKKLYYCDKRPVLEASIDKVIDGQIGAVHIDDLTAIWIFDPNQEKYVNNIEYFRQMHYQQDLEKKGRSR